MDCETLIAYLSDYIDHNLSEELAAAAREHLGTCKNCQVMLDSTERVIHLYRDVGGGVEIPAKRRQRLYDQLEAVLRARPGETGMG
ncbi:MAG TPA: zf-HC2 domain-containing protein [Candidatus Limnocylindrales bacterium]|nr:zf-HC2 domain-containing protein [Candidatus Limnocylindrales bacterium]